MAELLNKKKKFSRELENTLYKESRQQNDMVDGESAAGIIEQTASGKEMHIRAANQGQNPLESLAENTGAYNEIAGNAVNQQLDNVKAKTEPKDFISATNDEPRGSGRHMLDNARNKEELSQLGNACDYASIIKLETGVEEGEYTDTEEEQGPADTSNNFPSNAMFGKQSPSLTRIKANSEFCSKLDSPTGNSEHIPDGFLDDLLEDADEIGEAIKLIPENNQNKTSTKIEPIPESFFDDILIDQVKERVEVAINEELEVKYSQKLEELKQLTRKDKQSKKHEKSRKRSRKRSHSSEREFRKTEVSDSPSEKRRPILPAASSTHGSLYRKNSLHLSATSSPLAPKFLCGADDSSPNAMAFKPIILKKPRAGEEFHENVTTLSRKEKLDRAIFRVSAALDSFTKYSTETQKYFEGEFIFTPTVRKLPSGPSFGNKKFYEHRSPLHTVNNVSYKFSSYATSFNMLEWGLEALPPKIAYTCRILCYDIYSLVIKSKSIKLPRKLQKLKTETQKNAEMKAAGGSLTLLNNVSTQTDDDINVPRNESKVLTYDIAAQAVPLTANMATQTTQGTSLDDLPIISIIRSFNDSQLMALHDFAELLREPSPTDAMNMYRVKRMLHVYKCAQIQAGSVPATIEHVQSPMIRNRRFSSGNGSDLIPVVENVYSADGSYYTVNRGRTVSRKSKKYGHPSHFAPSDPRRTCNSPSSSSSVPKSFGRGGIRR
ncbi:uncharacterized protein LOC119644253 [Glossina fuscipes]|uniref:Uncharacterized protein LOC119644253 n=1 Tax=Glossina fuscipes TaxID=7396 RepID=A0A9C5ZDH9_9MUSC|nr:uncharacterized protein LOC119644253 [Glossina fuscipes]